MFPTINGSNEIKAILFVVMRSYKIISSLEGLGCKKRTCSYNWVWSHTPIILVLKRLQEEEFKATMGLKVVPQPTGQDIVHKATTQRNCYHKH